MIKARALGPGLKAIHKGFLRVDRVLAGHGHTIHGVDKIDAVPVYGMHLFRVVAHVHLDPVVFLHPKRRTGHLAVKREARERDPGQYLVFYHLETQIELAVIHFVIRRRARWLGVGAYHAVAFHIHHGAFAVFVGMLG